MSILEVEQLAWSEDITVREVGSIKTGVEVTLKDDSRAEGTAEHCSGDDHVVEGREIMLSDVADIRSGEPDMIDAMIPEHGNFTFAPGSLS